MPRVNKWWLLVVPVVCIVAARSSPVATQGRANAGVTVGFFQYDDYHEDKDGPIVKTNHTTIGGAYATFKQRPRFDVRKTPSMMGLATEIFRRSKGVVHSRHPVYRMSALGPLAKPLTDGHERAGSPCGRGTPFEFMANGAYIEAFFQNLDWDVVNDWVGGYRITA